MFTKEKKKKIICKSYPGSNSTIVELIIPKNSAIRIINHYCLFTKGIINNYIIAYLTKRYIIKNKTGKIMPSKIITLNFYSGTINYAYSLSISLIFNSIR